MTVTAPKTRPSDRREQIARAAGRAFADLGYNRVAIGDIAASVGITGRAIYRHFASKHDLLAHTVFDAVAALEEAVGRRDTLAPPDEQLDAIVGGVASLTVERRELGVLLQRETRNLSASKRAAFASRADAVAEVVRALLRTSRPELGEADVDLLVRSAFAVLASVSYHRATLPHRGGERIAAEAAARVLRSNIVARADSNETTDAGPHLPPSRASRREEVLSAAIRLFAQRGYAATRMEDVGSAVGIAGPSIYEHFAGKPDLLMAALTRGAEWLQYGLSRALRGDQTPAEALERVVDSYAGFVLEHTDLMRVFLDETISLGADEQHALRRIQHDYIAEWMNTLRSARPGLSEAAARYLIGAVLGITHDAVRPPAAPTQGLRRTIVDIGIDIFMHVEGDR